VRSGASGARTFVAQVAMPYSLRWLSFQSILMPLDLEWRCVRVLGRGDSLIYSLNIAHAGNAADRGNDALQLLFIADLNGNVDDRAVAARSSSPRASRLRMLICSPNSAS